jgi:hypothetical protein
MKFDKGVQIEPVNDITGEYVEIPKKDVTILSDSQVEFKKVEVLPTVLVINGVRYVMEVK